MRQSVHGMIRRWLLFIVFIVGMLYLLFRSNAVVPAFGQSAPSSAKDLETSRSIWRASQNTTKQKMAEFEAAREKMRRDECDYLWAIAYPLRKLSLKQIAQYAEELCPAAHVADRQLEAGYTKLLRIFSELKEVKEYFAEVDGMGLSIVPIVQFPTPQPVTHAPMTVARLHELKAQYVGFLILGEHLDHSMFNGFYADKELHMVLKNPSFNIDPTVGIPAKEYNEKTDLWRNESFATFFGYNREKNVARYKPVQVGGNKPSPSGPGTHIGRL